MHPGFGYSPVPTVQFSKVYPPRIRYLYACMLMAGGFVLGLVLMIFAGLASENDPDALGPFLVLMAGWGLVTVGLLGGKAWLVLLITQRSHNRQRLVVQQRSAQL